MLHTFSWLQLNECLGGVIAMEGDLGERDVLGMRRFRAKKLRKQIQKKKKKDANNIT
jgi:hypothetical protein